MTDHLRKTLKNPITKKSIRMVICERNEENSGLGADFSLTQHKASTVSFSYWKTNEKPLKSMCFEIPENPSYLNMGVKQISFWTLSKKNAKKYAKWIYEDEHNKDEDHIDQVEHKGHTALYDQNEAEYTEHLQKERENPDFNKMHCVIALKKIDKSLPVRTLRKRHSARNYPDFHILDYDDDAVDIGLEIQSRLSINNPDIYYEFISLTSTDKIKLIEYAAEWIQSYKNEDETKSELTPK